MAEASWIQSAFLLFLFASMLVIEVSNGGPEGSVKPEECPSECARRCSKASHHETCNENCNKCCAKCLCVPSGTSGNKEECPCYNNWKTKEGGPKCP